MRTTSRPIPNAADNHLILEVREEDKIKNYVLATLLQQESCIHLQVCVKQIALDRRSTELAR